MNEDWFYWNFNTQLINEIIGNGILNEQCIDNIQNNTVSFNCSIPMDFSDAIPDDIEPFISTIYGQGAAAIYTNGQWIGSLVDFTPYTTYQFEASGLSEIPARKSRLIYIARNAFL